MRRVEIYKWEKVAGQNTFDKMRISEGIFIRYGSDYQEFESGAGNFSTAIVEMDDGTVKNVPVDLIKFLDKP
jgi:hypothetical protein